MLYKIQLSSIDILKWFDGMNLSSAKVAWPKYQGVLPFVNFSHWNLMFILHDPQILWSSAKKACCQDKVLKAVLHFCKICLSLKPPNLTNFQWPVQWDYNCPLSGNFCPGDKIRVSEEGGCPWEKASGRNQGTKADCNSGDSKRLVSSTFHICLVFQRQFVERNITSPKDRY